MHTAPKSLQREKSKGENLEIIGSQNWQPTMCQELALACSCAKETSSCRSGTKRTHNMLIVIQHNQAIRARWHTCFWCQRWKLKLEQTYNATKEQHNLLPKTRLNKMVRHKSTWRKMSIIIWYKCTTCSYPTKRLSMSFTNLAIAASLNYKNHN